MGKFIVIDGLRAYTVCVMSFGVSATKSGAEFLENFRNYLESQRIHRLCTACSDQSDVSSHFFKFGQLLDWKILYLIWFTIFIIHHKVFFIDS